MSEERRSQYAELYLKAWERSDNDRALIPHEDIVPVFQEYGFNSEVLDSLRYHDDWTVWTPDSRETPLYSYTPDLAGDTSERRGRIAELFAEAGAGTERFINVLDGQKGSFDTGNARAPDDPEISGNYGVKGGRGGDPTGPWLIDIDVDDYDEAKESNPRVEELRSETLGVASAHTTVERPGHLYVLVDGDPRAVVRDILGREVDNPQASFGEIRVEQQYVVGPGSEIICGCDRCTDPDAPDHFGRYELATEQPPITWSEEEFREFLLADPAIEPAPEDDTSSSTGGASGSRSSGSLTGNYDGRIELAKQVDEYTRGALKDARNPDDRSEADALLARSLAPWFNFDESALRDALDDHGTSKWQNRGSSYRNSVINYALSRPVDGYDTVPYWAVVEFAVKKGIVDREDLVHRDSDTGDIVDDPTRDDTYQALPSQSAYQTTLDAIENLGVEHNRDRGHQRSTPFDPTESDVTLDPREAWLAVDSITPGHLDDRMDPALEAAEDNQWICPQCGDHKISPVRARALVEDAIVDCEATIDADTYQEHYRGLRHAGAPLPKYISHQRTVDDLNEATAAVGALRGWHIVETMESEQSVKSPSGDVRAVFDPSWEDSDSGERIVLFNSGLFYCRKHEIVIDPIRIVALEQGIITDEDAYLGGQDFLDAYRVARTVYGAPLPEIEWNTPDETPEAVHIPKLPPADDLLGEGVTSDKTGLDQAREETEELYCELADSNGGSYLLTVLPALGKTTSVVKHADEHPTLYTAGRKELMQEVAERAQDRNKSWMHLPILSETRPPEESVNAATSHIRRHGKDVLRDDEKMEEFLPDDEDEDDGTEVSIDEDEFDTLTAARLTQQDLEAAKQAQAEREEVNLDRETCEAAEGGHGELWQLKIHVARQLGYTPREIHVRDTQLFGEPIPCHEEDECSYSVAWQEATDPDAPKDLLIGHYIHGFVPGARQYAHRDEDDRIQSEPRTIVVDEYPGDSYQREFGPEFMDHAAWLAGCLSSSVQDIQDLSDHRSELWADDFVADWLAGDIDHDAGELLEGARHFTEAVDAAENYLESADELQPFLRAVTELEDPTDTDAVRGVLDSLGARWQRRLSRGRAHAIADNVVTPLEKASRLCDTTAVDLEADDHLNEDLQAIVEDAIDAVTDDVREHSGLIDTALTALRGGREGVEALAAAADDGAAHPKARQLLVGYLAPTDDDTEYDDWRDDADADIIELSHDPFQKGADGGRAKSTRFGNLRVLVDRDQDAAVVNTPPNFDGNTVIGLDATGREQYWSETVLEDLERRDIHDTPAERRAFLRDVMNHQVVQTSPHINSWEGNPHGKDLDKPVALVEAVADRFGQQQLRQDRLSTTTKPGVITTRCVRDVLEDRLLANGAGVVDNYGNMIGSNALSEHNIGVVLGTQHYGHSAVERFAALAGEEVSVEGRGANLQYNSPVADSYLKRMREDKTMQAALRFGRDEEGAVVFAHTSALREDLPVTDEAAVVEAYSETAREIGQAATQLGSEFTVSDVQDRISNDVSTKHVRRVLNEFATSGYLRKRSAGRANEYDMIEQPSAGDVELPGSLGPAGPTLPNGGVDRGKPGHNATRNTNTTYVWVTDQDDQMLGDMDPAKTALPSPEAAISADPPG